MTEDIRTATPTDLELMLYADGELEEEKRAAVEAYLARDRSARLKMLAMGLTSEVVREQAAAAADRADDVADAVMAAVAAEAKRADAEPAERRAEVIPIARPARDRGRGLWPFAAVALAAAAALLLWGRSATTPHGGGVASSGTTSIDAPVKDSFDHGVEVSAVDFGSLTGAIFYVPTGPASEETTTVVWLSDDSAGGKE